MAPNGEGFPPPTPSMSRYLRLYRIFLVQSRSKLGVSLCAGLDGMPISSSPAYDINATVECGSFQDSNIKAILLIHLRVPCMKQFVDHALKNSHLILEKAVLEN
uniref:Uncharacterized protein n=1 Tax=Micrurus spixii TaxID=129469 RepID=A0A2D4M9T2_9SAUR